MNKVTNTTKDKLEAELMMLDAAMGGGSSAILHQEARGQAELTASQVLPTKGLHEESIAKMLDYFAFKVKGYATGHNGEDQLFTEVVFPEGWSIVASDHSMWSYLVDPQGRKRASIFYKAAFYDRDAHIGSKPRYYVTNKRVPGDEDAWYPAIVDSNENVMWAGNPGVYSRADLEVASKILKETGFDPKSHDWDTKVEFPPSLYTPPKLETYTIHTTYLSDGQIVDRGTNSLQFKDDEAAKKWWNNRGHSKQSSYDVRCEILCGTRSVAKFSRESASRRVRHTHSRNIDFDVYGHPFERE
jgi:hypothetical protein